MKEKKILLVEDDPFLVDIYTTKLGEENFTVEVATDGEEALRKISDWQPDLLLLDIVLPRIDGWEILKKIKENPGLKGLKVVVLSNLGQTKEVKKGMDLGATAYLIKAHYAPSEIIEEVKKVLAGPTTNN